MDAIPKEFQLPLVVVIGLIGFLIVIGMSRMSAVKDEDKNVEFESSSLSSPAPTTPKRSTRKTTPLSKKEGSVQTPAGRRSARLARTRKED